MTLIVENPSVEWPKDYIRQLPLLFQEVHQKHADDIRNGFDRIDKIYNPGAESKSGIKNTIWVIGNTATL